MKDKKASKSECVKVAIRVRPMNKHEIEENSRLCVTVDTANNTVSVISDKNPKHSLSIMFIPWKQHKEKFMIKLLFLL